MTALTDERSIPVCAIFCGGNESDMNQLPRALDEARRIHGDLSQFTELLADKGYDSHRKPNGVSETWTSTVDSREEKKAPDFTAT